MYVINAVVAIGFVESIGLRHFMNEDLKPHLTECIYIGSFLQ